jgi:Ran GTPase-activating protein (RanGAP) involved in mRNA processing and transport
LCPPLRCLILANNDLFHYDTSALVALAGAFRTMPDLTSLWLSYNGSGNTDTATHYQHGVEVGNLILACARDIPTLCHMRCTENNIPEPLQSAIDLQVRENRLQEFHRRESGTPVVTDLDLSSRHIESDDANMLKSWIVCMTPNVIEPRYHHDGLPTRDTVTALNLSDNAFDWQGVVHIAACITSMSALTDLNLSDNDSGGAHPMGYCAAELGVALATTPSNLTVLRLAFMNMLARDAIHIARGIQEQKSLKVLDVSGNPLYAEGGTTIATSLKALKLEELYFASCNIGRPMLFVDAAPPNRPPSCVSDLQALRVLDDAIKRSNTIVTLDISGNKIRADGFQLLAPSLHSRNSITHLNLSNNYISQFDDGSRYVELRESYANIARMQSLIHLDFTDNEIHRDADPADYQADIAMRDDIRWCRENTNIAVNFMAHQFKRNALYGNTYCTTINGHSEVTEHLRAFLIATAYTYGSARRYACAIRAKRVTMPEELGAGPSKRSVTRSLSLLFAELSCGEGFEVKVATLVGRFL